MLLAFWNDISLQYFTFSGGPSSSFGEWGHNSALVLHGEGRLF